LTLFHSFFNDRTVPSNYQKRNTTRMFKD
jgi:hypothetical protein